MTVMRCKARTSYEEQPFPSIFLGHTAANANSPACTVNWGTPALPREGEWNYPDNRCFIPLLRFGMLHTFHQEPSHFGLEFFGRLVFSPFCCLQRDCRGHSKFCQFQAKRVLFTNQVFFSVNDWCVYDTSGYHMAICKFPQNPNCVTCIPQPLPLTFPISWSPLADDTPVPLLLHRFITGMFKWLEMWCSSKLLIP